MLCTLGGNTKEIGNFSVNHVNATPFSFVLPPTPRRKALCAEKVENQKINATIRV